MASNQVTIILTDSSKRILWVNQNFPNLTGYSFGEALGRTPKFLQGVNTERDKLLEINRALTDQIPIKSIITNYKKSGKPYSCELIIYPIFNTKSELCNFISFERDVTYEKEIDDQVLPSLDGKYYTSSLKGNKELEIYFSLRETLEREELYLKPDITISEVSKILKTNTKYLSQVINNIGQRNFLQFINEYRIEHYKRILSREKLEHLTLFGLALQSGFKNKSTFYKVFKEVTGITPREYLIHL
jgi:PAS domain S-box-containing protein